MAQRSSRYTKARALVDANKKFVLRDGVDLLTSLPQAKFDETIEVSFNLGVDPRKAEENIRGAFSLPHGTGKVIRLLVFCRGPKEQEARAAGADYVGSDDLIEKIQGGWFEFDSVIATPDMMGLVGKIGRILGPRGLMPNPKVGTVTNDVGTLVKAVKGGRVEYRVDKAGIIHLGVGKVSFGVDKIIENIGVSLDTVIKAKPKSSKGIYFKRMFIASTMSPAIEIDISQFKMN